MNAKKDIAFQAPVEMRIAWEIARQRKALIFPNGKGRNADRDFLLWIQLPVEVKCDHKSEKTGNLYFEVQNCYRDEPSGLRATKASEWAYYIPHRARVYTFCPKRMLEWLESQKYEMKLGAGDGNSNGYVVPLEVVAALPFVDNFEYMI